MKVIEYRPEHMAGMRMQEKQLRDAYTSPNDYLKSELAFTCIDGDRVVCCGGIIKTACDAWWRDTWVLWAAISADAGPCMTSIVRVARRLVQLKRDDMVIAVVRCDFKEAHRLVKLVGLSWHHDQFNLLGDGVNVAVYIR